MDGVGYRSSETEKCILQTEPIIQHNQQLALPTTLYIVNLQKLGENRPTALSVSSDGKTNSTTQSSKSAAIDTVVLATKPL